MKGGMYLGKQSNKMGSLGQSSASPAASGIWVCPTSLHAAVAVSTTLVSQTPCVIMHAEIRTNHSYIMYVCMYICTSSAYSKQTHPPLVQRRAWYHPIEQFHGLFVAATLSTFNCIVVITVMKQQILMCCVSIVRKHTRLFLCKNCNSHMIHCIVQLGQEVPATPYGKVCSHTGYRQAVSVEHTAQRMYCVVYTATVA